MGTGFDRDGLVDDVTLDPCSGGKAHLQATDAAHDATVDDHVIGGDFAFDGGAFANGQQVRADVTLNCAFDLNVTGGFYVAGDVQIGAQQRCRRLCLGRGGLL